MKPITIVDARMGRGKTEAAKRIQLFNKPSNTALTWPYLSEV